MENGAGQDMGTVSLIPDSPAVEQEYISIFWLTKGSWLMLSLLKGMAGWLCDRRPIGLAKSN